jgi:hypothetical protein
MATKRISCIQTLIVDPIPDNFDNNIRGPFLNTLISNIQSRFENADIIDQLAILDLTGTDLIECMYVVFYLGLKRGMVFFFSKGHFARIIYQKGHIEKIGYVGR